MSTGLKVIDIFDRINENNDKLFKQASWQHFLNKAEKEIAETKDAPKSKRLLEYADVLICVLGAAAKDGCTLQQLLTAVEHKLDVNDRRTFIRQPDGTYQHVEGK